MYRRYLFTIVVFVIVVVTVFFLFSSSLLLLGLEGKKSKGKKFTIGP